MKAIKIVAISMIILLISGCGKGKKIECAYYEQSSDFKMEYDYTFNYDESGNILKTLELITSVEFDNKEDLDEFVGQADNNVCAYVTKTLNLTNNVKCKSKEQDNKISVTLIYDYAKLTDNEKDNLFGSYTYDEFKKLYESNNYEQDICVFNSDKKMEPVLNNNGALGTLNNAQKSAVEDSAYGILKSAETAEAEYMINNMGELIPANDSNVGVVFVCNGEKCLYTPNGKNSIVLDFKGAMPTSGEILLDKKGNASIKEPLIINGYKCITNNDKVECNK